MKKSSTLFIALFILGTCISQAQKYDVVAHANVKQYELTVLFYDPYKNLLQTCPDFKDLTPKEQEPIWNDYLLNNAIYDFQLSDKRGVVKHYILRGNPQKNIHPKNLMRNAIYVLDVVPHKDGVNFFNFNEYEPKIAMTLNKIDFYGTLFGQTAVIRKHSKKIAHDVFGRHRLLISYAQVKKEVKALIEKDLSGEIDPDWILKDVQPYTNAFFPYQQQLNQYHQIDRIEKKYIRRYDANGGIQSEYSSAKIDQDIASFRGKTKGIGNVVTLPFFKSTDKAVFTEEKNGQKIYQINTQNNAAIDYYLEDIKVVKTTKGDIEFITATLLLHGSSVKRGDYIDRERYIAYFKSFEQIRLPYRILYAPLEDIEFKRPRIEKQLDYLFHTK
jgi:hypothetical protein